MIQIIYTGTVDEELLEDWETFRDEVVKGLPETLEKSEFIPMCMDSNPSQHLPKGKLHFTMFISCIPQQGEDSNMPGATPG